MASKSLVALTQLQKLRFISSTQRNLHVKQVIYTKNQSTPSPSSSSMSGNVPGLSSNVITPASGPVGPGATKESPKYKNPEYFCYHTMSYHEAEIEMAKYRCPQPSSKRQTV